jgi:hypothetical protein
MHDTQLNLSVGVNGIDGIRKAEFFKVVVTIKLN